MENKTPKPSRNVPLSATERQNYEEAISKLTASNALIRFLLTLILVLAIVGNILLFIGNQTANREAVQARERQDQILNQIKDQSDSNGDNTQRILNYLNCVGTVPVEQRTREFIEKCFTDASTAPPAATSRREADPGSSGGGTAAQTTPSQGGVVSSNPPSTTTPNPTPTPTPQPQPEPEEPNGAIVLPVLPEPICLLGLLCIQ